MVSLHRLCCIVFCAGCVLFMYPAALNIKACSCLLFFSCLIKFIYRKAAQKWHPDNFQGDEKKIAEKKFIDIAAAKEVLTDPGKPNFIFKLATQIQGVPLATEPGISLIILTPVKILQQNRHTLQTHSSSFLTQ